MYIFKYSIWVIMGVLIMYIFKYSIWVIMGVY